MERSLDDCFLYLEKFLLKKLDKEEQLLRAFFTMETDIYRQEKRLYSSIAFTHLCFPMIHRKEFLAMKKKATENDVGIASSIHNYILKNSKMGHH